MMAHGLTVRCHVSLGHEVRGEAMLTFEEPPRSTDHVMSRQEIAAELNARPGDWAVVARPDRVARAETLQKRIANGQEYGQGYAALVVKVGAEIRVYAQRVK